MSPAILASPPEPKDLDSSLDIAVRRIHRSVGSGRVQVVQAKIS